MRYLFGMDREVVEHLREAWDYLDGEYCLDLWPIIKPTVELCLHTTINELISLHYILDYDVEEYLHHCNWHHVDDYIAAVMDNKRVDSVFDDIVDTLESNVYVGNKLAVVISRNSRCIQRANVEDRPVRYNARDLRRTFSNAIVDTIIDTLRSVEIIDYLPKIENELAPRYRMSIQDVDINFDKLKLTIHH